jgi:hypothetical protein
MLCSQVEGIGVVVVVVVGGGQLAAAAVVKKEIVLLAEENEGTWASSARKLVLFLKSVSVCRPPRSARLLTFMLPTGNIHEEALYSVRMENYSWIK